MDEPYYDIYIYTAGTSRKYRSSVSERRYGAITRRPSVKWIDHPHTPRPECIRTRGGEGDEEEVGDVGKRCEEANATEQTSVSRSPHKGCWDVR